MLWKANQNSSRKTYFIRKKLGVTHQKPTRSFKSSSPSGLVRIFNCRIHFQHSSRRHSGKNWETHRLSRSLHRSSAQGRRRGPVDDREGVCNLHDIRLITENAHYLQRENPLFKITTPAMMYRIWKRGNLLKD